MNCIILLVLLQMAQPQKHSGGYSGLIMILLIVLVIAGVVLVVKKLTSKNVNNNIGNYPKPPMGNYTVNAELTTHFAFCPECGTKINNMRFCPNCGYDISSYNKKQQSPNVDNPNTDEKNVQNALTSNLLELKKLLDSGVITQEDYDKKKLEYWEKM